MTLGVTCFRGLTGAYIQFHLAVALDTTKAPIRMIVTM
jgi:hypothetical protein